jgi:hypothetical protein
MEATSQVIDCNTVSYVVDGQQSAVDIVHGSRDEDMYAVSVFFNS